MGLPATLVDFTSPIVEKALETGARGKTTTTTNYGVIGDAMFRKAQLDLGIAELKGNMGMRQAELMSGLEMQKAGMNLDMAKAKMDHNLKLQDLKMELEANEVGFFEGLLNVGAGAVGAAAIAATAGAATPVVIGAGAAGGLLTAGAQAQGGRRGAQGALNAIGTISQGASLLKGISQQQKGDDAWKAWGDRAQFLSGLISNPNTAPQERMQAMADLDNHYGKGFNVLTNDLKMNPQAAAETIKGVRGVFSGTEQQSGERARDFHLNTMQQAMEAKADPRFDDPSNSRQALKEFIAKAHKNYALAYGGKEIPNDVLDSLVVDAGLTQRKGLMDTSGKKAGSRVQQQQMVPEQVGPGDLASTPTAPARRMKNPRQGAPVSQPPAAYNPGAVQQAPGRAWHAPMVRGPGVEMDDGGAPAAAEQQLAKQGAEAVKALESQKDDRGIGDKLLHGGKVGGIGVPGLLSNKGVKADEKNRELDKKIEDQERRNAQVAPADPELKKEALAPLPGKNKSETSFNAATKAANRISEMLEEGELPTSPKNAQAYKVYKEGVEAGGSFHGVSIPKAQIIKKGEKEQKGPMGGMAKEIFGAGDWEGDPDEVIRSFSKADKSVKALAVQAASIRQKGSTNPLTIPEAEREIQDIIFSAGSPQQAQEDLMNYMRELRDVAATPEPMDDTLDRTAKQLTIRDKQLSIQKKLSGGSGRGGGGTEKKRSYYETLIEGG